MDRNLESILALAGTAAITVTLAAIAPGDAYAGGLSAEGAPPARVAAQYNHTPPAEGASIEDLKSLYLECDHASVSGRLTRAEAMRCSTIYEALKRLAFDGDFERLLAWSRGNLPD